jgi:hypothetical protein
MAFDQIQPIMLDNLYEPAPLWSGSVPTLPTELDKLRRAILVQHNCVSGWVEAAWVNEAVRMGWMFVKGARPQLSDVVIAGE